METLTSQQLPEKFEKALKIEGDKEEEEDDEYSAWPYEDERQLRRRTRDKSKLVVKDFLQQLKDDRYFDFSWPPKPDECAAYDFLCDFINLNLSDFEDKEDWYIESAKKFIYQVEKSWGYDVDCRPPWFNARFDQIEDGLEYEIWEQAITEAAACVIDSINAEAAKDTDKTFTPVKVHKTVVVVRTLFLLTLTIKDVEANSDRIVRAAVSMPPCHDPLLVECNLVRSTSAL